MQGKSATFQVYNASAGSGKTFTLVKEYLKIILNSDNVFTFQKVLAVTFTNKAAAEMKNRLLKKLKAYSKGDFEGDDMIKDVLKDTKLLKSEIQNRSKRILDVILKNYTAFSITTIDSFTHKIIKSFAYDLGLSLNFEVEMDPTELLSEAVDVLISKIGTDEQLTKVLIDFSLEKTDDDRAWDISRELNEFSKRLLNEDDAKHFKKLSNKTLEEFYKLRESLLKSMIGVEKTFEIIADEAFRIIGETTLSNKDFSGSTCPNFFNKLYRFRYLKSDELNFEGNLDKMFLGDKNLYASKADFPTRKVIEGIYDDLQGLYEQAKLLYNAKIGAYTLNKIALKSIVPLAVLNNINSELNHLKEENNIRLNAEFNQLISENIKDQPAPFIYERIGQRFMHYFIDEMQDTSILQWKNMIPLIDNALAQGGSDLMLVGDGKQAIYRWRGGRAEQFIDLGSEDSQGPFMIPKVVKNLKTNYRSYSEIIDFTNKFFQHTVQFIQKESYKNLYVEGNKQSENSKDGGCVTVKFIPKLKDKDEHEIRYAKAVLDRIRSLQSYGFKKEEICILVRTRKDGVTIANYLTENSVEIVSSETLLLSNSLKVNFIVDVIQAILHPKDEEAIFNLLYFLADHLKIEPKEKHSFLKEFIKKEITIVFDGLKAQGLIFDLNIFQELALYEKVEYLVRSFKLLPSSDAYVQFFLDVILEQQQKGVDLQGFLEYWEQRKDKLSVAVSDGVDKVRIMTIHKSKGLEFPVVIFPCDLDIYRQISPKIWLDKLPMNYKGFDELLLNYSKELQEVKGGAEVYQEVREELELDNFNLLYVALTRPVEQLHIITNDEGKSNHYSEVFKSYLEVASLKDAGMVNEQLAFSFDFSSFEESETVFGDLMRLSNEEEKKNNTEVLKEFISSPLKDHEVKILPSSSRYWDTEQGKAIAYGNQMHDILSKIHYIDEVDEVVNQYEKQGLITLEESIHIYNKVYETLKHPDLVSFYTDKKYTIYNERDILSKHGDKYTPDRLVIDGQNVIVIDYKTGGKSTTYHEQICNYGDILSTMGYVVMSKLLVYLNDNVEVFEVV